MGVSGSTALIINGAILRFAVSWHPQNFDLAQQACGTGRRP
jgi:hypothetical protein